MTDSKEFTKPLELTDFSFVRATLELRCVPNYLHWDRSGSIWTRFIEKKPNLKIVEASPGKTVFTLGSKYSFAISLNTLETDGYTSIAATANEPHASLKDLSELAEVFVEIVVRELEISEYKRIGLRSIFHKNFSTLRVASEALLSTRLISVPEGPHFGIEGSATLPQYLIKWEDDKRGAMVHLTAEKRSIEFNPPPDWEGVAPFKKNINRLVADFDYYTIASVAVGQFRATDWLNNALHLIKRDSGKFFRGA